MELFNRLSARGRRLLLGVLAAAFSLITSACNTDVGPQDYLSPLGPVARRADELWDLTFGIAVIIFVVVEAVLVYTLIRFRRRPGREAAQFHGNTKLEVVLTLVPTLILAGLAVPTVKAIADLSDKPANTLDITVTAKQFWWQYEYPDAGIVTANEMHVPTGQPVYLTLEGADVIHSFWIPKLTGKQDVVPGRTNNMYFIADTPGTYWGQCTEFCGLSHANMRLRVIAHEPAEFEQWLADQQQPAAANVTGAAGEGQQIFMENCVNCHAIAGTEAKGTTGPDLTHFASRETFAGAMFRNTPENLARWIDHPAAVKPGAQMPDYGLSAEEIDAVVAYLQTLE
ncbi:MAG: cytochrome c oxidase subunit II [Actinomycetota bacterium]|nr:cytochrome c oxidase subunit II [Actinomycetota bacterium]